MKKLVVAFAFLFVTAAALAETPAPKGQLLLIGGGENAGAAMKKFVDLAGGPDAPIVYLPTASRERKTRKGYETQLRQELGCTNLRVLDVKTREDAQRSDYADLASRARGIFFGGGDQVRITTALLDTPVGNAIADAYARGAVVAGTSAGTACQSALMITGEGDFTVIRANAVELKRGLGFFRGVIVDQHFIVRQRSNRLLSVILEHPDLLGVGVDEDTAVWVRPDGTFEVVGLRSVMVIDASGASIRKAPGEGGKERLGVHDVKLHVLLPGEAFDPATRAVIRPAPGGSGS